MGYTGEKKREYQREWMRKRRKEWFDANGPCVRCGSWEDLELDHKDRVTKITHAIWSYSQKRRVAELAKCQVLCKSCHLEKTRSELPEWRRGELSNFSILTEPQVLEIKRRLALGQKVKGTGGIAEICNVPPNTITNIKLGVAWKHVRV